MICPPRFRVAVVMASRGRGGLETHFVQLCNHLSNSIDVTAIVHQEFSSQLKSTVRHLPIDLTRSRRNPLLLLELLRALRRERFDIIHAHANKAVSLVHTIQPLLRACLIGTLHNQKQSTRVFRRLDHAIAVSKTAARRIRSVPVTVIYNGLPHPTPEQLDLRAMFNLPRERPVLLAAGRLVDAKGFDVLIDAVAPMEVSLLIAGDGEHARMLTQRVRRRNAERLIRLLGHRDDVTNLIASCDGVVISSRREGFSYVAAETLLLGQRLLSTDVPVPNEILSPELIVPVADAAALRKRLKELIAAPKHWDELIAPAIHFAREHFTIDAMIQQTLHVYERVLAKRPAKARV